VRKSWQILWIFSLQDVLDQKKRKEKWQEKFDEVGPVSPQHVFFGPKLVIFEHFHFSLRKTHRKNVKFCTVVAYVCVFKRKL
jgi:hypothetical protein